MDPREYILEIYKPPTPVPITFEDETYLSYVYSGINSAYKIYSYEKKTGAYAKAYKNVHKRVQGLLKKGLIEEIKRDEGFAHGAKNYRLTTRGLVHVLTEILEKSPNDFNNFIKSHQENIIIRTFINPLFEKRTITNATYTLTRFLTNYIIDCCEITRYCFDRIGPFEGDDVFTKLDLFDTPPINYMYYKLNWSIKSFILRCVILDEKREDWDHYGINMGWRGSTLASAGKIHCLANDVHETRRILMLDKKFMRKLQEIELDIRRGISSLTKP
jgi:hypothetical protein